MLTVTSLHDVGQYLAVVDLLPDLHLWVKDVNGCFAHANRRFYQRFGYHTLEAIVGKNDSELSPEELTAGYLSDDAVVLAGGRVVDRLEQIRRSDGASDWFLTSKWPVLDEQNTIIGSLGISRHLNRERESRSRDLQVPVDYIDKHFGSGITVKSIAAAANLSVSALERRFRRHLDKTPHQYLNEVRLERARQLLVNTDKKIGTIAAETGFTDHSHFTKGFTQYYGTTPSRMRARSEVHKLEQDPPQRTNTT